jgi:hypothetical protein
MAQFNYQQEINNLFNMEGEISKHIPRYMRKMENSSFNSSINTSKAKLSVSYNNSLAALTSGTTSKTPNKNSTDANKGKKTPNGKSPGKTKQQKDSRKFLNFIAFSRSQNPDTQ